MMLIGFGGLALLGRRRLRRLPRLGQARGDRALILKVKTNLHCPQIPRPDRACVLRAWNARKARVQSETLACLAGK